MSRGKKILLLASSLFIVTSSAYSAHKLHCKGCPNYRENSNNSSMYTRGPTVTTSPYLGIRSEYDGSDLIVNLPTMNEDLRLLRQRQKLKQTLGINPSANRPLVEISGDVSGVAGYFENFQCEANDTLLSNHDINLSSARFDAFGEAGEWSSAYISIDFDNSPLPNALPGSGARLLNSKVFLKRGFLTIGDLECSPFYFSIGQMYAPFGRYAAATISSPLTVSIGQTNSRVALFGYFKDGFFAQAYAFHGDSHVGNVGVNQWGLNAGYEYKLCSVHGEVGAGYIANIADATGIQVTAGSCGFRGFALSPISEILEQRVPAFDVHGTITYGPVSFIAEYIDTLRPFAAQDLSFNDDGARLSALHLELHAQTIWCTRPVGGSIAYGHSTDALGLSLPEDSFFVVAGINIWKNSLESIEFRHDSNYSRGDTAGGFDGVTRQFATSQGGSRNSIVGQVGVYF